MRNRFQGMDSALTWARICKRLWSPGIDSEESISPAYVTRARTFKCLWGPGIDAKEWIPPAYVVWRAGTKTLFLLGA